MFEFLSRIFTNNKLKVENCISNLQELADWGSFVGRPEDVGDNNAVDSVEMARDERMRAMQDLAAKLRESNIHPPS